MKETNEERNEMDEARNETNEGRNEMNDRRKVGGKRTRHKEREEYKTRSMKEESEENQERKHSKRI